MLHAGSCLSSISTAALAAALPHTAQFFPRLPYATIPLAVRADRDQFLRLRHQVAGKTRALASDENLRRFRQSCLIERSECAQLGEGVETFMREAANRPLARVGTADEIAKAALFLGSPMSAWITGIALVVDGGGLA